MAVNYTIRKAPYAHLDLAMRQTLERAWNAYVRAERAVSIRLFALTHDTRGSLYDSYVWITVLALLQRPVVGGDGFKGFAFHEPV